MYGSGYFAIQHIGDESAAAFHRVTSNSALSPEVESGATHT